MLAVKRADSRAQAAGFVDGNGGDDRRSI